MMARLVISVAVLLSKVGMKFVSLFNEVDSDSSDTNLNPMFC